MNNENNTIIKKSIEHKVYNGKEESDHSHNTEKNCLIDGSTEINACTALRQDGHLNEYNSCGQSRSFQESVYEWRRWRSEMVRRRPSPSPFLILQKQVKGF